MSKDELLALLHRLAKEDKDNEYDHMDADKALLDYINDPAVTRAFEDIGKWYA